MDRIVVGVDGSEEAAAALRWAVDEAALHGASVVALHAWSHFVPLQPEGAPDVEPGYGEAEAADALGALVEALFPHGSAVTIEQRVVGDVPSEVLVAESADADLLVVGARGLGGFGGLLMGSVSQRCLHLAHSPVCVVKSSELEHAHGRDRVVVGVDGSPTSQRALEWAAAEARARHAHLEVAHAWSPPVAWIYSLVPTAPDPAPFEAAAAELLRDMLSAVDTEGIPKVIATVSVGGAAADLLEAAQHAQLVVVGSRGISGFGGMLVGSVCHAVTQHAPCPVVVIPAADPR